MHASCVAPHCPFVRPRLSKSPSTWCHSYSSEQNGLPQGFSRLDVPSSYWNQQTAGYADGVLVLSPGTNPTTHVTPFTPQQLPPSAVKLPAKHAQSCTAVQLDPIRNTWWVQIHRDYSSDWPNIQQIDGQWVFRPGFLDPVGNPSLLPGFVHQDVITFQQTNMSRVLCAIAGVLYASAVAGVYWVLWQMNPLLSVAVGVNWARRRLPPWKFALIFGLAYTGKLWLYYVLFFGKRVDEWLEARSPDIQQTCRKAFAAWMLYLLLAPINWPLIPFIMR